MASPLAASTAYSGGSTANVRIAGAELNGWFSSIGLVQTADTGQVNWTTATVAVNTSIGYETWRSKDSSFYFKLEWQAPVSNTTGTVGFFLTVGTGTDGAGNITGTFFPRTTITGANNTAGNSGAKPSYFSHTNDYLGVVYKVGALTSLPSHMAFAIEKMVDTSGSTSGSVGWVVSYMGGSTTALMNKRALRTTAPTDDYGVTSSFCAVPANLADTSVGSDRQVFLHAHPSPRCIFSNFLLTIVSAELPSATTFTATPVGATPGTFISIGSAMGCGNSASASTTWGCAMRWE